MLITPRNCVFFMQNMPKIQNSPTGAVGYFSSPPDHPPHPLKILEERKVTTEKTKLMKNFRQPFPGFLNFMGVRGDAN